MSFRFLPALLIALLAGCEPLPPDACRTPDAKACCFLSKAEAEAPLGFAVLPGDEQDFGDYSACIFRRAEGDHAPSVALIWYYPDAMRRAAQTKALQPLLMNGVSVVRPNVTGILRWAQAPLSGTPRENVLYVDDGAYFYALSGKHVDGHPEWLMEGELARSVQRRIKLNRQQSR